MSYPASGEAMRHTRAGSLALTARAQGVVISRAELERMRRSVQDLPETTMEMAKRTRLQQTSHNRVKNWPNTLQAMRRKKENWKREKLAAEERKREEVDREEAALQRRLREEAVGRAEKLMYAQTDRMKQLQSRKLFMDVVDVRAHQVTERRQRQARTQEDEQVHFVSMKRSLEAAAARETEEEARKRANAREIARIQAGQLDEMRERYIAALQASQKEGEDILARAKADTLLEVEERRAAVAKEKKAVLDMAEANRLLESMRVGEDVIEAAEEEKRKKEREAIEGRERRRKQDAKRRFDEKQAIRQRLIDRAAKELTTRNNNEEERLERHVKEARDREAMEEQRRKEKQREQKRLIDLSHSEQMVRHQHEKEAEDRQATAIAEQWRQEVNDSLAKEAGDLLARRREARRIREEQQKQIAEKQRERAAYLASLRDEHDYLKQKDADEDAKFLTVLEQEIEIARRKGKNAKLLERLRRVEPEALLAAI